MHNPVVGFAMQPRLAQRWFERNTFSPGDLPDAATLADRKASCGERISVVLPALNEEDTIGAICARIRADLIDAVPLVDELVVIDSGSTDRTVDVAREAGARVVDLRDAMPSIPVARGKGEALWRSLAVTTGDIVCWIDADIRDFGSHFVSRLVAPLVCSTDTVFVKGFYRRPLDTGGDTQPDEGGRVTELLARPLLNALFPELAGLVQPLSGEYAGRRSVLEGLPFFSGYSVEVGMLIDLLRLVGLDAIAQVDLEERVHRNRSLRDLTPMAYTIARTILRRAEEWGRLQATHDYLSLPLLLPQAEDLEMQWEAELERPPITALSETLVLRAPMSAS